MISIYSTICSGGVHDCEAGAGVVLYCTVLYCTVLYFTVLYCTAVVACMTVKLELGWSRDRAGEAGALLLPGKLGTHLALSRNKHFQPGMLRIFKGT